MKYISGIIPLLIILSTFTPISEAKAQENSDIVIGLSQDDLYNSTLVHFGINFEKKGGFAAELGENNDGVIGKLYLTKYLLSFGNADLYAGLGAGTGPQDELIAEAMTTLSFSWFFVGAGYGYDKFSEETYVSLKGGLRISLDLSM